MSRRSRAREIVLQVLYQSDLNPDQPDEIRQRFISSRLNFDGPMVVFARELIEGIRQKMAKLDQQLELTAQNWKLSRMAATDRNVLRLGAYEVLYTDTPDRVAINEAIELAKRYGSKNSAQFVNGILDQLMKRDVPVAKIDDVTQVATPPAETAAEPSASQPPGTKPNRLSRPLLARRTTPKLPPNTESE